LLSQVKILLDDDVSEESNLELEKLIQEGMLESDMGLLKPHQLVWA